MTQSTTTFTPFYLLYGRTATLPLEFTRPTYQLVNKPDTQNLSTEILQRTTILQGKLKQAQETAQTNICTAQDLYKQQHDARSGNSLFPRFKIGDQVLRFRAEKATSMSHKLAPSFDGPYYIHQVNNNGTYKLRRPSGQKLKKLVHGNLLKLYKPPHKPQPFVEIIQWPKS
jgi:hypothetical protein